jgi:hypothetical protein
VVKERRSREEDTLALRKKIIQRCRRMRLEALGAFSYGAK